MTMLKKKLLQKRVTKDIDIGDEIVEENEIFPAFILLSGKLKKREFL